MKVFADVPPAYTVSGKGIVTLVEDLEEGTPGLNLLTGHYLVSLAGSWGLMQAKKPLFEVTELFVARMNELSVATCS